MKGFRKPVIYVELLFSHLTHRQNLACGHPIEAPNNLERMKNKKKPKHKTEEKSLYMEHTRSIASERLSKGPRAVTHPPPPWGNVDLKQPRL